MGSLDAALLYHRLAVFHRAGRGAIKETLYAARARVLLAEIVRKELRERASVAELLKLD
jgi:hypothetical protein